MASSSQVESIFFAALEKKTAAERAAYLDEACGGDAELRLRVERLLEAHPQARIFWPNPPSIATTSRPTTELGNRRILIPQSARKQAQPIPERGSKWPSSLSTMAATMWEAALRVCSQRASGGRQPPVFSVTPAPP